MAYSGAAPQTDRELLLAVAQDMRDIRKDVKEIGDSTKTIVAQVTVLWTDRSIWNWVIRTAVLATPIVVIVVNFFSN